MPGHVDVQVPVVVQVAPGDPAAVAHVPQSRADDQRPGAAIVADQQVGLAVVGHVQVEVPVVVVVAPGRAVAVADVGQHARAGRVVPAQGAAVLEEAVGAIAVRQVEVLVAVVVVVAPGRAGAVAGVGDDPAHVHHEPGDAHVGHAPQQDVGAAAVGHVQIQQAVAVVVGGGDRGPGAGVAGGPEGRVEVAARAVGAQQQVGLGVAHEVDVAMAVPGHVGPDRGHASAGVAQQGVAAGREVQPAPVRQQGVGPVAHRDVDVQVAVLVGVDDRHAARRGAGQGEIRVGRRREGAVGVLPRQRDLAVLRQLRRHHGGDGLRPAGHLAPGQDVLAGQEHAHDAVVDAA